MAGDYRDSSHLPKVRDGHPVDPRTLPRQRRGVTPQMHGRYPDFDVMQQLPHWDAETAAVVRARVEQVPELTFFRPEQARTLSAFCDHLLAQEYEPRIPVLAFIDRKLAAGELDGYRYADMPDDRDTWRIVASGLDASSRAICGEPFADAAEGAREQVVAGFAGGDLHEPAWDGLNVSRAFAVVARGALAAYYAHPWAWNEIGFGGPAYPRGYARIGIGLSEAWEGEEAFTRDPGQDEPTR